MSCSPCVPVFLGSNEEEYDYAELDIRPGDPMDLIAGTCSKPNTYNAIPQLQKHRYDQLSTTFPQRSNMQHMHFKTIYALVALLLFIVECIIANWVGQPFIRKHLGDLIVVILIYFATRSITSFRPIRVAIAAVTFAYVVELSQAVHLIDHLGLSRNWLAILVLGNTYQPLDLVMYLLGGLSALRIDQFIIGSMFGSNQAS